MRGEKENNIVFEKLRIEITKIIGLNRSYIFLHKQNDNLKAQRYFKVQNVSMDNVEFFHSQTVTDSKVSSFTAVIECDNTFV